MHARFSHRMAANKVQQAKLPACSGDQDNIDYDVLSRKTSDDDIDEKGEVEAANTRHFPAFGKSESSVFVTQKAIFPRERW